MTAGLTAAALALLAACGSSEYIISTKDGTLITARGKPELDDKTQTYTYEDDEGRTTTIPAADVKQVMQR
jgi:hypothetical protein